MGITYRDSSGNEERTEFVGAVLGTREQNLHHDSYFHAVVWDEERQEVRSVEYGATAYYSNTGVTVDATREVIGKAVAQRAAAYLADWERSHKDTVRMGYTARVTVKGETLTGVVAWVGEDKPRSAWAARYGTRTPRYGIKVEGRKGYVFRNHGAPSLEVDVPAWTEEDRAEMTERAEGRARHDFAEALRLADKREPLPAAPAPGTVVDAQEADETGMRLYAVGESFCEESWARGVAEVVVDQGAAEYSVMGHRADGSKMPAREVAVFRALGMVARWVENDGARVCHDGRGVVRIVREDGARLMLAPVRPFKGQEDGQEGPGALEGAEVCTHPSECGERPVGAVRATKRVTGEGGVVVGYCSGHLGHPADTFPGGYVFEYLTTDGRGPQGAPQEGVSAPVAAQEQQEGPARSQAAMDAVWALLDDKAPRYRRTVLGRDGAHGATDTMEITDAWLYLVEEVAAGGALVDLRRGEMRLTRANGARLRLAPVA